jgi:hypothetical protein
MDMVSLKDGYFRNQKTKKNIEKKQDRLVVIVRKKKRKKSDISTVRKRDEGFKTPWLCPPTKNRKS